MKNTKRQFRIMVLEAYVDFEPDGSVCHEDARQYKFLGTLKGVKERASAIFNGSSMEGNTFVFIAEVEKDGKQKRLVYNPNLPYLSSNPNFSESAVDSIYEMLVQKFAKFN